MLLFFRRPHDCQPTSILNTNFIIHHFHINVINGQIGRLYIAPNNITDFRSSTFITLYIDLQYAVHCPSMTLRSSTFV